MSDSTAFPDARTGRPVPVLELPPVVGGAFDRGLHRRLCQARRRTYWLARDNPSRGGD